MRTVDLHRRAAREGGRVFVGIDSHKDSLAACVVDGSGREVRSAVFENSPAGHRELLAWARLTGTLERFGIEGSANLGAGLARLLMAEGEIVCEVPCEMTVRERRRLRRPGKSDPTDALAIARVAAREDTLPPARRAGWAEDLKVLSDYRDQLVVERNAEVNRLHADLAIVCPGYARRCRTLVSDRSLSTAGRLLRRETSVRAQVAKRRIGRLRKLDRQIAELATEIAALVQQTGTHLTEIVGIGPLLAARILGEVASVSRYPSAAHFASANGTAPIPASSGRTDRHRLNRGGNRRLNRALHYMALTQANFEPRAIAYLARKQSEGKTRREALRCLKRRLSDVVYRTLVSEAQEGAVAA
jgi:transposase